MEYDDPVPYAVFVRLHEAATKTRAVMEVLEAVSVRKPALFFSTKLADAFGVLIDSKHTSETIVKSLTGASRLVETSVLARNDNCLVLQLGHDYYFWGAMPKAAAFLRDTKSEYLDRAYRQIRASVPTPSQD